MCRANNFNDHGMVHRGEWGTDLAKKLNIFENKDSINSVLLKIEALTCWKHVDRISSLSI